MAGTVRIKITMKDGAVFELEKGVSDAKAFVEKVEHDGYHDQANSLLYPSDSVLTIEVLPPDGFLENRFSEN